MKLCYILFSICVGVVTGLPAVSDSGSSSTLLPSRSASSNHNGISPEGRRKGGRPGFRDDRWGPGFGNPPLVLPPALRYAIPPNYTPKSSPDDSLGWDGDYKDWLARNYDSDGRLKSADPKSSGSSSRHNSGLHEQTPHAGGRKNSHQQSSTSTNTELSNSGNGASQSNPPVPAPPIAEFSHSGESQHNQQASRSRFNNLADGDTSGTADMARTSATGETL